MTTSNSYGRAVDVPMVNKTGAGVVLGDAVIYDTTNNDAFTTTTSTGSTLACGIAQETIANNGTGRIRTLGYTSLATPTASVTRGHYGYIGGVAKQVTDAGASRIAGTFLYFLSGGTTPDAIIYPVDLAGAALTNPMTTVGDLIRGGASGAPTPLAASATAGQFLMNGGAATAPAWASRELDYVEFTSSVNITATVEGSATTIVTGSSVAYDGSTPVLIEFYVPAIQPPLASNAYALIYLFEDGSSIGRMASVAQPTFTPSGALGVLVPTHAFRRMTPSNASHTYSIRAIVNAGTGIASVGAGGSGNILPGFIRIARAI